MKTHLDYSITLPHHEDSEATMEVSISGYTCDGPKMSVKVDGQRITLTSDEVIELAGVFSKYLRAQRLLEGVAP